MSKQEWQAHMIMATLLREGIGRHIGYTVTAAEWRAKAAHALEDHAALLEKEQPR